MVTTAQPRWYHGVNQSTLGRAALLIAARRLTLRTLYHGSISVPRVHGYIDPRI